MFFWMNIINFIITTMYTFQSCNNKTIETYFDSVKRCSCIFSNVLFYCTEGQIPLLLSVCASPQPLVRFVSSFHQWLVIMSTCKERNICGTIFDQPSNSLCIFVTNAKVLWALLFDRQLYFWSSCRIILWRDTF